MPRNLCTFLLSPFLHAFQYYIKHIFFIFFSVSPFVVTFPFLANSRVLFQKVSLKCSKGFLNLKNDIQRPKVKVTPSLVVLTHSLPAI